MDASLGFVAVDASGLPRRAALPKTPPLRFPVVRTHALRQLRKGGLQTVFPGEEVARQAPQVKGTNPHFPL